MRRRAWAGARLLAGAAILAGLFWRLGTGPFLDGLRGLRPGTLLAAVAIGVVTTVCSAWRWRVVAVALGLDLPLSGATAAYYRSQFLNSALPGGVLGDLHRGLRHGVDAGDLAHGVRAVVWERIGGQVVQVVIALAVLLALPSPVDAAVPWAIAIAAAAAGIALLAGRRVKQLRAATVLPVVFASVLVVGGHLGMFLLAARAAGLRVPPEQLLPLALVVLLAAAIPLNVGGWGPREGVSAWIFAAAGWGAGAGAAVATAFGVLTLVAVLPGAAVLLAGRKRLAPRGPGPTAAPRERVGGVALSGSPEVGAARG